MNSSFLRHPQPHFALFTTFTHWPISISAARIQWKHHLFPFPLSTEDRREILNSISPFLPSLRFRTIIIPFPLYCYIRYTPLTFPPAFVPPPSVSKPPLLLFLCESKRRPSPLPSASVRSTRPLPRCCASFPFYPILHVRTSIWRGGAGAENRKY